MIIKKRAFDSAMNKKDMDELQKKKRILTDCLDKCRQVNEFATQVANSLDTTNMQIEIIESIPDGNDNVKSDLTKIFSSDYEYINKNIPHLIIGAPTIDSSLNAFSVSGSTSGYNYILDLYSTNPRLEEWKNGAIYYFDILQERQKRFDEIIRITRLFDDRTADEFSYAKSIINRFKSELVYSEELGLALRNPMDHLKGVLWNISMTIYKKENGKHLQCKCTLLKIAETLVKNGKDSVEFDEITEVIYDYRLIYEFLSSILKRRVEYCNQYINEQVIKYIDVLYSFLNLLNLEKMKNAL